MLPMRRRALSRPQMWRVILDFPASRALRNKRVSICCPTAVFCHSGVNRLRQERLLKIRDALQHPSPSPPCPR